MVRLLGMPKKGKKRLSPSARTPEERRDKHPLYQYAINEFNQTVAAGTSNDSGKSSTSSSWSAYEDAQVAMPSSSSGDSVKAQPSDMHALSSSMSMPSDPSNHTHPILLHPLRSPFESEMPDAVYEELYGDAYTGGPIKYLYPSGYQSMRPRSCPWKLSIVVCGIFTWLSVFIVGHCSDQADITSYMNEEIDDDALAIDIRWCGSRPLYLMWVTSMLITGIAAAYCSVIGYIKVRDFAVGNSRSQPPGIVHDKSDYYVKIEEGVGKKVNIYQSDGTPQFWGAHIYRPTQAAVAIASR